MAIIHQCHKLTYLFIHTHVYISKKFKKSFNTHIHNYRFKRIKERSSLVHSNYFLYSNILCNLTWPSPGKAPFQIWYMINNGTESWLSTLTNATGFVSGGAWIRKHSWNDKTTGSPPVSRKKQAVLNSKCWFGMEVRKENSVGSYLWPPPFF